jgi:hypothetical protein
VKMVGKNDMRHVTERVLRLGPTHCVEQGLNPSIVGEPRPALMGNNGQKDRMTGNVITAVVGHVFSTVWQETLCRCGKTSA